MRTLAFDGRMGASGDMLLGALLAAGADRVALEPVEDALDVRYEVDTTTRCGITATAVEVLLEDADREKHHRDDGDGHHDHSHDDSDDHVHAEGSGPHRSYPEVVEIVESLELSAPVQNDALAIFELLGEAEASVHGTDLESTQFHEVGADDAIADVVGACLLLADLDPDGVVTTPLATGGGSVETSHGTYPVPTPAVVELAERADWSLRGGPVETELLTPTGAAVLAHVADGVETLPSLRVEESGYGAGNKSFPSHPNVLRALVGESAADLRRDPITVLETNLDDATPEVLGGLQETLGEAGALDVSVVPATMKKSRPGHLVKVVVKPDDVRRVARKLAAETGTLGVREHGSGHRFVADREVEAVTVEADGRSFEVGVKVARMGRVDESDVVFDVSAEYDDAAAVAAETGVPIREVLRRAERVALRGASK
ncbi:nickel pincer cofactor biosynthesis protein LarC [Halobacteriales archaeon QH_2_65_14]|nr:MAG: nickel pincer cofactor biosynthesis protein LarC [Halobacteriales archaeon QH_2_65_14]